MGKLLNYLTIIITIITLILSYMYYLEYIHISVPTTSCIILLIVYLSSKKENDKTIYETMNKKDNVKFEDLDKLKNMFNSKKK